MVEQIDREVWIGASAGEVWEAVVSDGWLAEEVALDLRPGGEAAFVDADRTRTGWVEDACAPHRLVFWWADGEEPASRVSIELEESDGRTRVRVAEARPLEVLDLVGMPLRGAGGHQTYGPALVAA